MLLSCSPSKPIFSYAALSSIQGSDQYEDWKYDKFATLAEFLGEFPALQVPASLVLSQLPLLQPVRASIPSPVECNKFHQLVCRQYHDHPHPYLVAGILHFSVKLCCLTSCFDLRFCHSLHFLLLFPLSQNSPDRHLLVVAFG